MSGSILDSGNFSSRGLERNWHVSGKGRFGGPVVAGGFLSGKRGSTIESKGDDKGEKEVIEMCLPCDSSA